MSLKFLKCFVSTQSHISSRILEFEVSLQPKVTGGWIKGGINLELPLPAQVFIRREIDQELWFQRQIRYIPFYS